MDFLSPFWLTYITSIVVYGEVRPSKLRLAEALVRFVSLVHFLREGLVCRFWKHAAREGKKHHN